MGPMTKKARAVLEQALKLSPAEQAALIDQLTSNLEEAGEIELVSEFAAELERRASERPPRGGWPTGDEVVEAALRRVRKGRTARGG